jgi:hypothetical protein
MEEKMGAAKQFEAILEIIDAMNFDALTLNTLAKAVGLSACEKAKAEGILIEDNPPN